MKKKESTFLLVSLDDKKAKTLANVMSSDTARKILDALTQGSLTETQIAEQLGQPLSTVHYNLRQLVEGGLVDSSEFHYSSRGREVAHYSLARKYIIIAPRGDDKIFSKIKNLLSAFVLTTGIGIAFWLREKLQTDLSISASSGLAPIMQKSVADSAGSLTENATELFLTAAPSDLPIAPVPEPSFITWFFAGAATLLVCWALFELVLRKKD